MSDETVKTWQEGAAGHIRLNRPAALNALTLDMVRAIDAALSQWEFDDRIALLILDGEGPRGLCAGGDIRALYDSGRRDDGEAELFWREEYQLNARINGYPKPLVAYMDGIVMGGGVGLSSHASHRVVTEKTGLAMPEVGIGFIPDVGGTYLLARAPNHFGRWMGLTGDRIGAADVIAAGFADLMIEKARLPEVSAALALLQPGDDIGARVSAVLAQHSMPAPDGVYAAQKNAIAELFAADSVEAILAALDADGGEFATRTAAAIRKKSPTSLKLTLRALGDLQPSLRHALQVEFRVALRLMEGSDFYEGVRATVIDKGQTPAWQPPTLEQISNAMLAPYFADLGERELRFS
jgi:enoyl-CoA hydratase